MNFVAIAEDNQPVDKVIYWVEQANATFLVLHDQQNELYEIYKPNVTSTLVVDEDGKLVRPWIYANINEETFADELTHWVQTSQLPPSWLEMEAKSLPPPQTGSQKEAYARLRLATILIGHGKAVEALNELKKAHKLDPQNYVIEHQLRVLEKPDDYYKGEMPAINR